jgi:hypothetical protein
MRRHPWIALFFVAVLVGACIPSEPARTSEPSRAPSVSSSSAAARPSPSEEPTASTPEEQASASAAPTAAPTEAATPSPAGSAASPSAGTGSATACSGTDENRTFFEDAAAAVSWTVYCAVLPAGWFVDSGQYRGSAGGRVEIAYKGPGGARLELHEGAFCSTSDGCVPPGTDAGDARFGAASGTLVALDAGGWAVVVDRGKSISWLAIGTGMDQATAQRIVGDLALVGG